MRWEHYIGKTKGKALPKQAVAIAAQSRLIPHPALETVEIEQLEEWSAWVWRREAGKDPVPREERGKDASSFWSMIDGLLRRGTLTWCFSMHTTRVMALLSFWEEMEAGRVYMKERDYRNDDNKGSDLLPKLRGPENGAAGSHGVSSDPALRGLQPRLANGSAHNGKEKGSRPPRSMGYCVLEDPPTVIQCRRRGRPGSLRIIDLRNYGYSGSDCPTENREASRWIRETVVSMCRTVESNDLGSLQNTAASQALHSFKHRFMRDAIFVHCDPEALSLERESYYGGRAEAGRIGLCGDTIWHLDYKSFYPAIGAKLAVPVRLVGRFNSGTTAEVQKALSTCGAIANVLVQSFENTYPLRRGAEVIFPTGKFWTVLAGPELGYALENGAVKEIGEWNLYEKAPAFSLYATSLSSLRCEAECRGDNAGAEYLKRLGVALYGKWGQTSSRWVDSTEREADHPYECWWEQNEEGHLERWRSMAWEVQREQKARPGSRPDGQDARYPKWKDQVLQRETGESCPAIASYVTSAGRIELWKALCIAGKRNVFYYDTDSLFVNDDGLWNLNTAGIVRDGQVGYLSLRNRLSNMDVRGIKHYIADGVLTCAGLPRGEKTVGPDKESYYLRAWIGRNINSGRKPNAERVRCLYQRMGPYLHGVVGKDGWVEPWRV